jgi:hypothetical protein
LSSRITVTFKPAPTAEASSALPISQVPSPMTA